LKKVGQTTFLDHHSTNWGLLTPLTLCFHGLWVCCTAADLACVAVCSVAVSTFTRHICCK